jgi:hypothetical protein
MKRGAVGTVYEVSKRCMPPYVAELAFHYNIGRNSDIFGTAIIGG